MPDAQDPWTLLRLEPNGTIGFRLVDERTGKTVKLNGVECDALTFDTAAAIEREIEARRDVPLPR